jgi:2-polyprenyl-3-methyl-5-hydroxy-6-metoxy-1,4-benzoquinol methylase
VRVETHVEGAAATHFGDNMKSLPTFGTMGLRRPGEPMSQLYPTLGAMMAIFSPADDHIHKERVYFNADRQDLLELVPSDPPGRVLDIGAAEGSMLVALKQSGRAREAVGVELVEIPGGGQHRKEIDRFIIADVEKHSLDLEPESFDVVICGDILEHLRDPWSTLAYLTGFLRGGGRLVASLPNILYWRAFARICLGDFRYAPAGVLDRTHLRFFCKKNVLELVRSAGLEILSVEPSFRHHQDLRRDRILNAMTLGLGERFFTQQYLVLAEKQR